MSREYHFKRHLIEARTNRFRLGVALTAMFVAAVGVVTPSILTHAATTTTSDFDGAKILNSGVSAYGGTTSGPFSSATVTVKRELTGVTSSSTANPFSFIGLSAISGGDVYLVSVSPVTVGGYTVKGLTYCIDACVGFVPQSSNFHPVSALRLNIAPNHSYHLRWIYMPTSGAPVKTTSAQNSSTSQVQASSSPNPNIVPGAVPSVPGNFKADLQGSNALVELSWNVSTDVNGVQAYKLERSLDRSSWTVVGGEIVIPSFLDDTVAFGVHYYYRVSAVSIIGKASGYATADVATGEFAANSVGSNIGNYLSEDKLAGVEVPAGAIASEDAVCTVEKSIAKFGTVDRPVVAGPYTLVCKNASGDLLIDFIKPVSWTFMLKTKLSGFNKPGAMSVDSTGGVSEVKGATFNANAQTLQFNQSSATTTAVLASKSQGIPGNLIAVLLVLIVIIGGVFALVLRKSQKQNYNEYLRKKYYDL